MKAVKEGQIVKFHTPPSDEKPGQVYVILEIKHDDNILKANIQPLNTGLPIVPVNTVRLDELEVVEVPTSDLMGLIVKIKKSDSTIVLGRVIFTYQSEINLDLSTETEGVQTNVHLKVLDRDGVEHFGTLFVN